MPKKLIDTVLRIIGRNVLRPSKWRNALRPSKWRDVLRFYRSQNAVELAERLSDAGDVDGLARLLPDYYLYVEDILRQRQIVEIAKRHGLTSDPAEPVAIGEAASSQTVLSERLISYSIPAKPRYPTSIKQALSGYGPVCRSPEVKLHTLTNCTAIFLGICDFFFDADGGFIRECSDPLPAFLNERIKGLLKDYPPRGGHTWSFSLYPRLFPHWQLLPLAAGLAAQTFIVRARRPVRKYRLS